MIVDCTMFHWEFDILELRMRELWDTVDYFVITESECDHRGNQRELALSNNLDKFSWAQEKMIVGVSSKLPSAQTTWDHEKYQRLRSVQYAFETLNLSEDDFLIISDVDEIARPAAIQEMAEVGGKFTLHMPMYYYYLNLYVHDWFHPKGLSVKYLSDPNAIRTGGLDSDFAIVYNSGWHFSYLGDENQIRYKLKTFAHDEMDTDLFTDPEHIRSAIKNNVDLFDRFGNAQFQKHTINNYWPNYIMQNMEKYQKYILR